jgi:glycosyl hydrolase family 25
MSMRPKVVDIYYQDKVESFAAMKAAGIEAVIHKATQGTRFKDPLYEKRKADAKAAGLLWGAYHFGTGAPVDDQVGHFLEVVGDDPDTLLVLDFEPNTSGGPSMSIGQAKDFLRLVAKRSGQKPAIYGGHALKDGLRKGDPFLAGHRLWLCQYGPRAVLPPGWQTYWLWQYTGDGVGPGPHEIAGSSTKGIDLSVCSMTDLAAGWIESVEPVPEPAAQAAVDLTPVVPLPAPKEMVAVSRKYALIERVKTWLFGGGIATLIGGKAANDASVSDPYGIVQALFVFAKSHGVYVAIGTLVIGYVLFEVVQYLMRKDKAEGRYTPSGEAT